MRRILAIHTGGTISMSSHEGVVSANEKNPLTYQDTSNMGVVLDEIYPIQKPSPHITLLDMNTLREIILAESANYDGFVITHGTDTLEETAYFLDLSMDIMAPVVVTGAMRSSNEIGSDGLYNYIMAVRVAGDAQSSGRGTLIVFNDEIHAARYVTKTHTSNIATFQSPNRGPVGFLTKDKVLYHHLLYPQDTLDNFDPDIKVGIIKAYAGLDDVYFDALIDAGYDGVILEALGQGNLPPSSLDGLERCLAVGMRVVLVSRSFNGVVGKYYDYVGGGYNLAARKVIFSNGLNGQKARIALGLALSNTEDHEEIRLLFEKV